MSDTPAPVVEEIVEAAPAVVVEEASRPTVYIEGYGLVYEDTGEPLEIDPDAPATMKQAFNSFETDFEIGESEVEWFLRKLFRLDGNIVASEARLKAEVDAIQKNWKPEINRANRAKESLVKWFTPLAKRYAERQLLVRNTKKDGSLKANPEKTVKFPQGSLAFKAKPATPEKVAIQAEKSVAEAVAWAQEHFPDYIIQTPSIDWARFTEADREYVKTQLAKEEADCPLAIVEAIPSTEEFTIKTGVK